LFKGLQAYFSGENMKLLVKKVVSLIKLYNIGKIDH